MIRWHRFQLCDDQNVASFHSTLVKMEDGFHAQRSGELLSAILQFKDDAAMRRFYEHMDGPRMGKLLERVSSHCGQTVNSRIAIQGGSPVFSIVRTRDTEVVAFIDHRYIGGVLFLRMVEAVLNVANSRTLPHSSVVWGVWYVLWYAATLIRLFRRPPVVAVSTKTFVTKTYTLQREVGISRRFQTYAAFLQDAHVAFQRHHLVVGFTVPFENGTVNNIGLVLMEVHASMDAIDLEEHFMERRGLALATNTLSKFGGMIPWMRNNGARFLRERIDVICTTLVAESPETDMEIFVRAGAKVFEGAYAFLFSRIGGDAETKLCATVTTNHSNQRWSEVGFA